MKLENLDLKVFQYIEGTLSKYVSLGHMLSINRPEYQSIDGIIELLQSFKRLSSGENPLCRVVITSNGRIILTQIREKGINNED